MRTLLVVLRPLVVPGIATAALHAFLFSWTEFLGALSFMTNDSLFTLPVALSNVETGTYGAINYGLLLAGAVIAMIPCIVVYVPAAALLRARPHLRRAQGLNRART